MKISLSLGVFYTGVLVAKNTLRHPELSEFVILLRPFSMVSDRYPSVVGTYVLVQYSVSSHSLSGADRMTTIPLPPFGAFLEYAH